MQYYIHQRQDMSFSADCYCEWGQVFSFNITETIFTAQNAKC
jgi:hypothetical protein